MKGQIGLFEYLNEANKPTPQLAAGDTVYILSLDVVVCGKVEHSWIRGKDEENPYFGYSVNLGEGHTTIWDYMIGDKVFKDEQEARRKAESLCFEKIDASKLVLTDCKSFSYIREYDGRELTATVAKVGERQLYEHKFMCYHFLRDYANTKRRDDAYLTMLAEIIEDADGKELEMPALDVLYKVNDSLYASRGCAEHNGVKPASGDSGG